MPTTLDRSAARPRHVALTKTFVVERWMGPSSTAKAAARARGEKAPALRRLDTFTVDARTLARAMSLAREHLSDVGLRSLLWLGPARMRAIIEPDRLPRASIKIPLIGKRRGARIHVSSVPAEAQTAARKNQRRERRASTAETRERARAQR